jgi:hypothetical protein
MSDRDKMIDTARTLDPAALAHADAASLYQDTTIRGWQPRSTSSAPTGAPTR